MFKIETAENNLSSYACLYQKSKMIDEVFKNITLKQKLPRKRHPMRKIGSRVEATNCDAMLNTCLVKYGYDKLDPKRHL